MSIDSPPLQGTAYINALLADDKAAQALGLVLLQHGIGRAQARMKVRADMANAFGICHGGFVFALADSVFGLACNSYGDPMVAAGASIEFLAPTQIDDTLTATATETMRTTRHGIYDVVVTNNAGDVVAHFRGRCSRLRSSTRTTEPGGMNR